LVRDSGHGPDGGATFRPIALTGKVTTASSPEPSPLPRRPVQDGLGGGEGKAE
jgi:hypothetical protein